MCFSPGAAKGVHSLSRTWMTKSRQQCLQTAQYKHLCCVGNFWTQWALTSVSELHITAISITTTHDHHYFCCLPRRTCLWHRVSHSQAPADLEAAVSGISALERGKCLHFQDSSPRHVSGSQLLPTAARYITSNPQGWEVSAMAHGCKLGPLK